MQSWKKPASSTSPANSPSVWSVPVPMFTSGGSKRPVIASSLPSNPEKRSSGKFIKDAQIAATALSHDLPLATRNGKDFKGIHGLTVLNPWA